MMTRRNLRNGNLRTILTNPLTGMRKFASKLLPLVALGSPLPALADPTSEQLYTEPVPVVLTPSRLPQPADESPSAITVIDRETIEATGARKLIDVLRLVPGMVVGSRFGNLPTLAYHGLGDAYARRLQVLVDGRSTWQPATGGVFWFNLPLPMEDIERIEVIRGPNAASFGSSALTATINIRTRHAAESEGFRAKVTRGTDGIEDAYLSGSHTEGSLSYRVSLQHQQDDGYPNLHDGRHDDSLHSRFDYTLSPRDELRGQFGIAFGRYDAGLGTDDEPLRDITQQNNFQYLVWHRALAGGNDLQVSYARNHFENHQDFTAATPVPGVTIAKDYFFEVTRQDIGLQHTIQAGDRTRVVWNANLRRDAMESEPLFDTHETQVNDVRQLSGHVEHRLSPRWILNAGAMVEESDLVDAEVAPRAAIIFKPRPTHALRLAVNTGTRLPTLWENQARRHFTLSTGQNYYDTWSSGGLDLERSTTTELGYRLRPRADWCFDFRVFRDEVEDFIVIQDRPSPAGYNKGLSDPAYWVHDFVNAGEVTITGAEVQSRISLGERTRLRWTYAHQSLDADSAHADLLEPTAPEDTLSALLTHEFPENTALSLFYARQDSMQWIGPDEPIDGYDRLDVRLAKDFRVKGHTVEAELVGQNLSGDYADFRQEAEWDRTVFLSLSTAI